MLYHQEMKKTLEKQEMLDLKQGEVIDLLVEDGVVKGVIMNTGAKYLAQVVILATGTFLGSKIFIGDNNFLSGPNGMAPSISLAESLKGHGIELRRFKTGTPARVLGSTLDYDKLI